MTRGAMIAAASLALAACGGGGGGGAATPATSTPGNVGPSAAEAPLGGKYVWAHEVMVVCDGPEGWCPEETADVMLLTEQDDGLQLEIELVQTNAHTCTFSGLVTPVEPGRVWQYRSPKDAMEEPCELTLTHTGSSLQITSEGCRDFCGARATLDATFDVEGRVDMP
ncbi:MAG: hypothetical protein R2939_11530 [Kofleriaceae bacterium]